MIYWFYGQPGAGKTTLARALKEHLEYNNHRVVQHIDGDEMRSIFNNTDYSKEGRIKLMIIPDIESVNYGRGVGYHINEHVPPQEIKEISATKIRNQLRSEGKL